ncbi:hypothetical protein L1049_013289 [Liquidambar formosana]|uniref:SPX domain-containing protein n=1 Tax=Liquidambar formosana TaxID=63359 RepID=A0AAP0WY57_LIQFO
MKFWKILNSLIEETLPDWRDKFLSYKDLKKQLKLIYPKEGQTPSKRPRFDDRAVDDDCTDGVGGERDEVTKEVIDFVRLLEDEIEKFNAFFVDKEEMYVITLKCRSCKTRVRKAKDSNEELLKVGREMVDFHGEMVLLENYSALNYTGVLKILKKYDKLSGALIRLPFIQKVLQQPFYSTDLLNKLVKECETMLDHLFSMNGPPAPSEAADVKERCENKSAIGNGKRIEVPKELSEIKSMENMYVRLTLSALRVLKEVRGGSSTVSEFSLPPLQTDVVEDWRKIPVVEQVAK